MSREKRDAERAARRAKRLAARTEARARRQERHAQRAAERAERLAERVRRRPEREKNLDQSIEDMVDEVTEKAEAWIDEQARQLFGSADEDREVRRAEKAAMRAREAAAKARQQADRAGKAASDLSELEVSMYDDGMDTYYDDSFDDVLDDGMGDEELWMDSEPTRRRSSRRSKRRYGTGRFSEHWSYDDFKMTRRRRRGWRSPHLYRDRERKKVCGVCAGVADYFGRPAWEIRLYTVLGLFFLPSLVVPAYFIMYFLMDDKPYYRRVTDRVDEDLEANHDGALDEGPSSRSHNQESKTKQESAMKKSKSRGVEPRMNNDQAMSVAKEKFSDIEQRLRQMETHVTSSRFELQREIKKISGED
ncbi:MAG: PspC domain-containing protein [Gammaproteobacteria bacterium]